MLLDCFIFVLFFLILSMGNGCLIFFLWWIIGQPQTVMQTTAQFTDGRIFSSIGRRLCDWYEIFAQKEEDKILEILNSNNYDSQEEKNLEYYNLGRTMRKPNPAKAWGVCVICMGSYLSLIINIIALILIGYLFGPMTSLYIALPFLVYGWAFSLTSLKVIFLAN